jgi:hypothetical protein
MKLPEVMIEKTLDQLDATVLPEVHPAIRELNRRFGDHTLFLDDAGLSVIEPIESDEPSQTEGVVVNLASWSDSERTSLELHKPEVTDIVVELGPARPGDDA